MTEQKGEAGDVTVPSSLIEDIHYHLVCQDRSATRSNAAHHLVELINKVGDLTTYHPGYDADSGTLPWQREDGDG